MIEREDRLRFGALTERTFHLCVDMQRLFAAGGPWPAPWTAGALPAVTELAAWSPARTVFARFIPPPAPGGQNGTWRRYFQRWAEVTLVNLDHDLLRLMEPLDRLHPPAALADRCAYSAFAGTGLAQFLAARDADGLIVSGAETDICVLASVLEAVDLGLRVVVAVDAVCSSSDQGHDAILNLFRTRFAQQIETAATEAILASWPR